MQEAIKKWQKKEKKMALEPGELKVNFSKEAKFGDYSSNIALVLSKLLKKNPLEIAEKLAKEIKDKNLEKVEPVPPGHLNFYLSKEYLKTSLVRINQEREKFGNNQQGKGIKVCNEFISANPTGPLHVGNGRGGFYGKAIGNILEKNGFEKINEYYINDGGNQILRLGHSVLKDEEACYQGEHLEKLNKEFGGKFSVRETGEKAADRILEEIIKKTIQEKMKIHFDSWISEKKDIDGKGETEKALAWLKEKNLTYEKEGALWLKSKNFSDEKDRVLIKSDGERAYLASDCGYILNKIKRGFSKSIILLGADHHGYISRIQAAYRALEFPGELKIIVVQMVRLVQDGKEVRMGKRLGNVVLIDDLIQAVGQDVANFFFLMYSPKSHMNFDLKLAQEKSLKNPVYYVQYAHARICSILRKAKEEKIIFSEADLSQIGQEKELRLIRTLNKFPDLVSELAETLEVHKLPYYAIKLADDFHSFYDEVKVIDRADLEKTRARLKLVNAVRIVLAETLRLMGVGAPEKM